MLIEHWIRTWRAPLTGLLGAWGAPWGDAAELAQDTLVEGFLARERLRGDPMDPQVAGPWLRGIARNLLRASQRQTARSTPHEVSLDNFAEASSEPEPEDPRLEPLRLAIDRLPETSRSVLYLHYLEDSPLADVAALLGISERAVEGRLRRARHALQQLLVNQSELTP